MTPDKKQFFAVYRFAYSTRSGTYWDRLLIFLALAWWCGKMALPVNLFVSCMCQNWS